MTNLIVNLFPVSVGESVTYWDVSDVLVDPSLTVFELADWPVDEVLFDLTKLLVTTFWIALKPK